MQHMSYPYVKMVEKSHPCLTRGAGRIEISAQNHNFAVDALSLPADAEVTHINLNDGTCAGLLVTPLKVRPEDAPESVTEGVQCV